MDFLNELKRCILEWSKDPIEDEWLFESFRKNTVNSMSPSEAFQEIDDTISVLLEISDESTAIEVLQTIIDLARQSNTTEISKKIYENKDALRNQFELMGEYAQSKLNELFKYYRLV